MSMNLITKTDETYLSFLRKIEEMDNAVSKVLQNVQPSIGNERYLTDRELSKLLNISRRTLQDYRKEGKITYFTLGGKILYRESDIEKLLADNYYPKSTD